MLAGLSLFRKASYDSNGTIKFTNFPFTIVVSEAVIVAWRTSTLLPTTDRRKSNIFGLFRPNVLWHNQQTMRAKRR